jgi:DNA anti-recombination protein RmuC
MACHRSPDLQGLRRTMTEYTDKLAQDLKARLDEVNEALAQYDDLISERDRLTAALDALGESAGATRD